MSVLHPFNATSVILEHEEQWQGLYMYKIFLRSRFIMLTYSCRGCRFEASFGVVSLLILLIFSDPVLSFSATPSPPASSAVIARRAAEVASVAVLDVAIPLIASAARFASASGQDKTPRGWMPSGHPRCLMEAAEQQPLPTPKEWRRHWKTWDPLP